MTKIKGFIGGSSSIEPRQIEPRFDSTKARSDLNRIAKEIMDSTKPEVSHLDYAPPKVREEQHLLVKQVETFGELPTKELDEIVAAAEAEIAALKKDAQAVRDMYMKHTQRIASDIKRLQEGVRLSLETMNTLREQVVKLDEPIKDSPPLLASELAKLAPALVSRDDNK